MASQLPTEKCPWSWPGRWGPENPLTQGMKIVITGPTACAREELIRRATAAGLEVMNSVSSKTSLVICSVRNSPTRKFTQATRVGATVVIESAFEIMLRAVRPGGALMHSAPQSIEIESGVIRRLRAERTAGDSSDTAAYHAEPEPGQAAQPAADVRQLCPGRGDRVLVLGGSHEQCLRVRRRVDAIGAQSAVRLTGSVTHVVALARHQSDPRWPRAQQLGLAVLHGEAAFVRELTQQATVSSPASVATRGHRGVQLPRGGVTDLPQREQFALTVEWDSNLVNGEVDVVAFVIDGDGVVGSDGDFCFYNQPTHPSGVVSLGLEISGEVTAEVDVARLGPQQRVRIAASLDGDCTFGDVGALELTLRTAEGEPLARTTLNAATSETSLLLADFYRRDASWRFRSIGQGYAEGLGWLATQHGVEVEV